MLNKYLKEIDLLKKDFFVIKTKLTEKFENLNAVFEECKSPLDQQIKRLWYENIAYERELKRYRNGLRELFEKGNIDPSKIVEIHTTSRDLKFIVPQEILDNQQSNRKSKDSASRIKNESELMNSSTSLFKTSKRKILRYKKLK